MRIRPATAEDYPTFVRLVPELAVDDPIPSRERWRDEIAPQTWIAEDPQALGYCYLQVLDRAGYVRHLVTAPEARRRGVGRALLEHVATLLRGRGATAWHLNVKPENVAARALYQAVGMRMTYASTAMRLDWAGFARLPEAALHTGTLGDLAAGEAAFGIPAGQLSRAEASGSLILAAWGEAIEGVAAYDPRFPGAFPFRARSPGAARALAEAIRAVATTPDLRFVLEDDSALEAACLAAGAVVRLRVLHYEGALQPSP